VRFRRRAQLFMNRGGTSYGATGCATRIQKVQSMTAEIIHGEYYALSPVLMLVLAAMVAASIPLFVLATG
jgi:hypothetical protein